MTDPHDEGSRRGSGQSLTITARSPASGKTPKPATSAPQGNQDKKIPTARFTLIR